MNTKNSIYNNKKTSLSWTSDFGLKFLDFNGFPDIEYYNKVLISKEDFLFMAANCGLSKPENVSRRDASVLKNKLNNNNLK